MLVLCIDLWKERRVSEVPNRRDEPVAQMRSQSFFMGAIKPLNSSVSLVMEEVDEGDEMLEMTGSKLGPLSVSICDTHHQVNRPSRILIMT